MAGALGEGWLSPQVDSFRAAKVMGGLVVLLCVQWVER